MDVEVIEREGEARTLVLREYPALYRVLLDEHGLRDIEAELARRRAMARACPQLQDRHRCGLPPGHGTRHECRACDRKWTGDG